jgi:tRNA pseudouridine55 synthase
MSSGEIILINKPIGWTSFDVVKKVRNEISRRQRLEGIDAKKNQKVGHAGTLDPLATGLLVLCTGSMTKKIDEIQASEKEYTGVITFGATRPSYDMETEIDAVFGFDHITEKMIRDETQRFTGEIQQAPPAHSAVKIDGVRAYKKARKGHVFEMKTRKVNIWEFEIVTVNMPDVTFRVQCSKGTYIRSLAHDFANALGSGAYLSALCRTRIGEYRLEEAKSMDFFTKSK